MIHVINMFLVLPVIAVATLIFHCYDMILKLPRAFVSFRFKSLSGRQNKEKQWSLKCPQFRSMIKKTCTEFVSAVTTKTLRKCLRLYAFCTAEWLFFRFESFRKRFSISAQPVSCIDTTRRQLTSFSSNPRHSCHFIFLRLSRLCYSRHESIGSSG